MIDVNWELSPERAEAATVCFLDGSGHVLHSKVLTRPTQTKTVADAVEFYNGEFPEGEAILGIAYSNNKIIPYYAGSPIADGTNSPESYIICTREQFEAYVKEQEGEKWTHLTPIGDPCFIKLNEPDSEGLILIEIRNDGYDLVNPEQLKPIKTKLTKAQAWDLCQDYEGSQGIMKYMLDLHEQYDII